MPNHVHVLVKPLVTLNRIVQSWKSFTGRWVLERNAELELGCNGESAQKGAKKSAKLELGAPGEGAPGEP